MASTKVKIWNNCNERRYALSEEFLKTYVGFRGEVDVFNYKAGY